MCSSDLAAELGVPEILFWTSSASGFLGYMHYAKLIEKRLIPLKGTLQGQELFVVFLL